jgi:hypothetical protein
MRTLFFLFCMAHAAGVTIRVPDDYAAIQAAIDAAAKGDTVLVAPDTYGENIDFKGKSIMVTSEKGPGRTVIDGLQIGCVVTFQSGEDADALLSGFTVTNGKSDLGCGICCINASPTMVNNIITLNGPASDGGGGIYCEAAAPKIRNNVITRNAADLYGGGIECIQASPLIAGNVIAMNTCGGSGGGIGNFDASPTVVNNLIYGNAAQNGGGIGCGKSTIQLVNNTLAGNSADSGAGLYIHFSSMQTVRNTILYGNGATAGNEIRVTMTSTLDISHSDVMGGATSVYVESGSTLIWGAGMIDADPMFVDPSVEDYHLFYTSPCRNAGDNAAVTEAFDFEGDPRIADSIADMGADEFHAHLYVTGDFMPGGAVEGKLVGLPGTSPVALFIGSGTLPSPMNTPWGLFHLAPPWVLIYPLGAVPASGVMILYTTLPLSPAGPYSVPMQALIGLAPDALTNCCVLEV